MADDEITKEPGSITTTADTSMDRISQVSNVNRAISEMQKKVDQQLTEAQVNIGDIEGVEKVQNSLSKVMREFSSTVSSIGTGFAKIAGDTARASTDTFKQYGKAISEDISYNKQNVVAMALSRTSPIFGYFAGKFMETDVFQSAKEKMKANLSDALGGVTAKLKQGWSSIFKRDAEKADREKPVRNYNKITDAKQKDSIPKMQTGGYVEKSGLVSLHAGEIVAPIEKILSRIDESIDITRDLAIISRKAQLNTLAKMSTYVSSGEKYQKSGMVKGFIRAMATVHSRYQEPDTKRLLRATLSMSDAMGANVGTSKQLLQELLINNQTLRRMAFAMKALYNTLGLPIKLIYNVFKARGGYQGHLSSAQNPMQATAENVGHLYVGTMWRLDNIANFTKATAEATRDLSSAITGKSYPALEGVPRGIWSIFGITRGLTNWIGKHGVKLFGQILGGPEFAKTLTEVMTKQRALPFSEMIKGGQRKALENIYDKRSALRLKPGERQEQLLDSGSPQDMILRVSEVNLERYMELAISNQRKISGVNYKSNKKMIKLLGSVEDSTEVSAKANKESNAREKRRSIFGAFGSIFKLLKGGGILGLLGSFLPMIGGLIFKNIGTGFIGKIVGKGVGKLLSKTGVFGKMIGTLTTTIGKVVPAIATGIGTFLKNPAMIKLLGTSLGVVAAGMIGWNIGKKIDEWLGISEKFTNMLVKQSIKTNIIADKLNETLFDKARIAREVGGKKGFDAQREVGIEAQFGRFTKERGSDIDSMGEMTKITSQQKKYMRKHMNEYLKYGPEQVLAMRGKWLAQGGFASKAFINPYYGRNRERAFLSYLKAQGKPLSDIETNKAYIHYQQEFQKVHGGGKIDETYINEPLFKVAKEAVVEIGTKVVDKGLEFMDSKRELLEQTKSGVLSEAKIVTKALEAHGDKLVDNAKKTAQGLQTTIGTATHTAITSIRNATHQTVNNAAEGYKGFGIGSYSYAAIKGDTDED